MHARNRRGAGVLFGRNPQLDDIQRLVDQKQALFGAEDIHEAPARQVEIDFGVEIDSLEAVEEALTVDVEGLSLLEHDVAVHELENAANARVELVDDFAEFHVSPQNEIPVSMARDHIESDAFLGLHLLLLPLEELLTLALFEVLSEITFFERVDESQLANDVFVVLSRGQTPVQLTAPRRPRLGLRQSVTCFVSGGSQVLDSQRHALLADAAGDFAQVLDFLQIEFGFGEREVLVLFFEIVQTNQLVRLDE